MSLPTIPGFTLGQKATSADQQAQSDALAWLLYKANGNYSQVTTAQTIPNDTDTAVLWNSNIRQYKVTHSTVTNSDRIIPQEPGLYAIKAKIQFTGNATGYRKVWVQQNGSSSATEGSVTHSSVGSALHTVSFEGDFFFNGSTDYFRVMVRQTSGGNLDLGFGEFNPRCNVMWQSGLV